jgi:hypothetical protein
VLDNSSIVKDQGWGEVDRSDAAMTTQRYFPFGFAFQKRRLLMKGARPVIYSRKDVLGVRDNGRAAGRRVYDGGLPRDLQYLWVGLDLDDEQSPTDWTHEREWRCKVDRKFAATEGLPGVPLKLGTWRKDRPTTFKVVVRTQDQETDVRQLVAGLYHAP